MVYRFGVFEVGQRYQNRRGWFDVLEITPPTMRIRYVEGQDADVDIAIQERIFTNMLLEARSILLPDSAGGRTASTGKSRLDWRPPQAATRGRSAGGGRAPQGSVDEIEFVPGQVYRRRDLNEKYGGQEQGGISTPRAFAIIFLFTSASGSQYGYRDHWESSDLFHYFGEGQIGDMEFIRGNKAIRDHATLAKELHLFETAERGMVRYVGRMGCVDYYHMPNIPDAKGALRMAIVFRLKLERIS